jgi:formyltetrahydrofolate deformylase|tara:strand:- start:4411 stop:5265 length:855 start_codon:yes stop_codon:yes gene_type:complete
MSKEYILRVKCPDKYGIVAKVSTTLNKSNLFILDSAHYGDPENKYFFMRAKLIYSENELDINKFSKYFDKECKSLKMNWSIKEAGYKPNTAIFVSKYGHCLQDLIYRVDSGILPMNISCIISNHKDHEKLADWHKIPFYYIPVNKNNKEQAEKETRKILKELNIDLIILARYMQILSDQMCKDFFGQIINIHHSFLPSFKGAKPYHQAYQKGVKILGATAHYVSSDLDEGPIIDQSVDRVDHSKTPKDLELIGRDLESITLARAVKYHLERRVFINNSKTVIFS